MKGIEVRKAEQLEKVSSLIIPGGESTTMAKLAHYHNLVLSFPSARLMDRIGFYLLHLDLRLLNVVVVHFYTVFCAFVNDFVVVGHGCACEIVLFALL